MDAFEAARKRMFARNNGVLNVAVKVVLQFRKIVIAI